MGVLENGWSADSHLCVWGSISGKSCSFFIVSLGKRLSPCFMRFYQHAKTRCLVGFPWLAVCYWIGIQYGMEFHSTLAKKVSSQLIISFRAKYNLKRKQFRERNDEMTTEGYLQNHTLLRYPSTNSTLQFCFTRILLWDNYSLKSFITKMDLL